MSVPITSVPDTLQRAKIQYEEVERSYSVKCPWCNARLIVNSTGKELAKEL